MAIQACFPNECLSMKFANNTQIIKFHNKQNFILKRCCFKVFDHIYLPSDFNFKFSRRMDRNMFDEDDVPYMTLSRFGLTREMIEDLPERVLEDIFSGHKSPNLPIHIKDGQGNTIHSRTRFALIRKDDGKADVLFFPEMKDCDLSGFNDKQREQLLSGKAIIADVDGPDRHPIKAFVQIDPETKHLLSVPTPVIGRNLQVCAEELGLDADDLQCIQRGATVSFLLKGGTVTMGIDLNSKTGLRFCNGDYQRWKSQRTQGFEEKNFGLNGCWLRDNDGNLKYVHETDYTDAMWQEQKEMAQSRIAHFSR